MARDLGPGEEPEFEPERGRASGAASLAVRLAWFVGLWAASVGFLAVVAYGIRLALGL